MQTLANISRDTYMSTNRSIANRFTNFTIQRCLRIMFPSDVIFLPISALQDELALAMAMNDGINRPDLGEELICIDVEGEQQVVVDLEGYDLKGLGLSGLAHGSDRSDITLCSGKFGGVYWRVVGFADGSNQPKDAIQLMVSNTLEPVAAACMGFLELLRLPRAMREYDEALDAAEKCPDGDDYNNLMALA